MHDKINTYLLFFELSKRENKNPLSNKSPCDKSINSNITDTDWRKGIVMKLDDVDDEFSADFNELDSLHKSLLEKLAKNKVNLTQCLANRVKKLCTRMMKRI